MHSTVLEYNGRLVYALVNDDGEVHDVISEQLTVTEEEVCDDCNMRMGICSLETKEKLVKLCRICLDKRTGAL